ncbi:MAG: hypothetical protein ACJZ81_03295 [Paracoccaceae bacterium]
MMEEKTQKSWQTSSLRKVTSNLKNAEEMLLKSNQELTELETTRKKFAI